VTGIRRAIDELRPAASNSRKPKPLVVPSRPELRTAYLQLMIADWRTLPLEALDPNAVDATTRRLSLEQVYVALDTTTPRDKRGLGKGWESFEYLLEPLSAVEALCQAPHRRMVLLGQPGSGKSTFARYLALTLAEALLQPRKVTLKERLPGWQGKARLPVFIPLRLLAASLPDEASQGTAGQVESCVRNLVDGREKLTGFGEPLLAALQDSGGLVIFDGLDEVPGRQRLLLKQALSEFAELYPRCTVLVTCRVHSYRQDPAWQLGWAAEHTLADFDNDKIEHFIDAWYGALAALNPGSRTDYPVKAQTLKVALGPDDPRGLRALAGTPLLLTVMAIVHAQKLLPDNRVGVYRECVDILLMRWQGSREGNARRPPLLEALGPNVSALKVHQGLREIAYRAHQSGERDRLSGSRALVSDIIIRGVMHKRLGTEGLELFLEYCRHANGLLLADRVVAGAGGETEARYVFPHLSFEEYLAALYLLQTEGSGIKEAVICAGDPAWREVIRFLGEYLCHDEQGGNPYLAKALLDALCPAAKMPADDGDWRRVWLASVLLPGWRREVTEEEQDMELQRRIIDRLVKFLQTSTALRHDSPARVEAEQALAWLGDPRFGVGVIISKETGLTVPEIDWVEIPAGPFTMGSGEDDDQAGEGEKSAHELTLPAFHISRYPITNAQYRPFVEAKGYEQRQWWTKAGWAWRQGAEADLSAIDIEDLRERLAGTLARRPVKERNRLFYWDDPRWGAATWPVIFVTWYEALAYCRWLESRLRETNRLPAGGTVCLPSEAEWEKAARGPEGYRWPWGNDWQEDRANTAEAGLRKTSLVGMFPNGTSPYGVQDMAGNVWEWTRSGWGRTKITFPDYRYPYNPNDGREVLQGSDLRVVRGGSSGMNRTCARCAVRHGRHPSAFGDYGFRVVLSLVNAE
jgi:formylglycine-generating enzyme required for sulfatase activity